MLLRSGTTRRETLALRTFEYTWARSGHWAIAMLPPDRLPATASEASAQEAALGFARLAFEAVAERHDSAVAWINLASPAPRSRRARRRSSAAERGLRRAPRLP
ncbi:MAG: hypothetical protein EOP38_17900 [Rubrivivax sp.]|nr:MAG: hypothetical protein EOP38_17900 [Rubrivivax sp.]